MSLGSRLAFRLLAASTVLMAAPAIAEVGAPREWQINMQPAVTPIAEQMHDFNLFINVIITVITLFVLALLAICVVRFSEKRNPVPSRTTHNTMLEVVWSVVPVLILVIIAIPSFRLLYAQYDMPKADLTIKVTGLQWFWKAEYQTAQAPAGDAAAPAPAGDQAAAPAAGAPPAGAPPAAAPPAPPAGAPPAAAPPAGAPPAPPPGDQAAAPANPNEAPAQASTPMPGAPTDVASEAGAEKQTTPPAAAAVSTYNPDRGGPTAQAELPLTADFEMDIRLKPQDQVGDEPYLLAVDNVMVVPVGKVVRVQVTAADVMHAFAIPAFGVKADAVPGRLNETWFRADREGIYYGQCSELCGREHAYMPIAVRVVSEAEYQTWLTQARQQFAENPVPRAVADATAASR